MKTIIFTLILVLKSIWLFSENSHELWLRNQNANPITVKCAENSTTLSIAINELHKGWQGKSGDTISLIIKKDKLITGDGFKLSKNGVQANTDSGILYGVYELLRRQKTGINIYTEIYNPSYNLRILNHWDNLDGSVERGYAGHSIFWRDGENALVVTDKDKKLWQEYARANASIGINGSVLNNVNASPDMLSIETLEKVKEIADILRPYGIKTFLSIKFSSPSLIGGIDTSDPLNVEVVSWWKEKVKEIYTLIPDFGGFLVKANSEGQPGPQDYGRTHVDGANMLADVVKPYGGLIMWRAFVYSTSEEDRAKQAFNEFMPFDGKFEDNVILQVKNGPIDFQPREPISPLFGAIKKTSIMPELQITQEYLGHSVHLVYLAPMWKEFFDFDTFQQGNGSTVARCTNGSIFMKQKTAIAGVANIGLDDNWCGHLFAQANWYAFGRLAWDVSLSSDQIAQEWIKQTFYKEKINSRITYTDWKQNFLTPIKQMMLDSREAAVNYMMPLGLHHIFAADHHYGPGPWWAPDGMREDWTPPYYHKSDSLGIGFDRTSTGSNAIHQYSEPLSSIFENPQTCPDMYLLWFHHLSWKYQMKSGRSLWSELCHSYDTGLNQVRQFQVIWDRAELYVDSDIFSHVQNKLREQCRNAQVWKDACLLYFQQFSKMTIPYEIERPIYNLEELIKMDEETR